MVNEDGRYICYTTIIQEINKTLIEFLCCIRDFVQSKAVTDYVCNGYKAILKCIYLIAVLSVLTFG